MRHKRPEGEEREKLRRIVLARDNYHCRECGADISAADSAHIHHVLPLAAGGDNSPANLISLCVLCHAAHHPAQGMEWRLRHFFKAQCYNLALLCDREGLLPTRRNLDSFLQVFGNEKFRAGQLPVVLTALKKQSFLFVSPTGSGKSLCFQLPALMQGSFSVVVCPLKVLMSEQVSDLWRLKIPASFINSDLSRQAKQIFYRDLRDNAVKITYMTPERFFTENAAEQSELAKMRPAFLIIDEAHCVDRWGAAFRPEYGRLAEARARLGNPPVLAFTATAGKAMQSRILRSLGCEGAKSFIRDVDRPNIALFRIKCAAAERSGKILELLSLPAARGKHIMIFVPTVKIGKMLKEDLRQNGIDVPFYHSNADNSFGRQEMVKRFKGESQPRINWIICTKAFGMGLDIPDVRLVIHWQQSNCVEDYLQEYGRAGRDGKQAAAVVFYGGAGGTRINKRHDDISLLAFMAEQTAGNAIIRRWKEMTGGIREATEAEAEALAADKEKIIETEYGNIAALQNMISADRCFRRALSSYFKQDSVQSAKPGSLLSRFALWIVGRLYASKPQAYKEGVCCDFCEKIRVAGQPGATELPTDPMPIIERLLSGG